MAERRPTEERRVQIAEAALRLISGKGVAKMTAQALAREVGIADGTIFRHFKDKAEIVRAAISHLEALLYKDFPPADPDPLARLRTFFVGRLELVQRMPTVFFAAFSDRLEEAAGEDGGLVRSLIERSHRFVHQCLVEAAEQGLIDRSLPPEVLTTVVLGTLQTNAFLSHRLQHKSRIDPEAVWQVIEKMMKK
jgi:AcrR family transcriptional regulator